MTYLQFARHCVRIIAEASVWAKVSLHPADRDRLVRPTSAYQFTHEIRTILDDIEEAATAAAPPNDAA